MKPNEWLARMLVGILVSAAVGMPLWMQSHASLIHARMADRGGWSVSALQARVGQPLHLRLTSDDVMHGFAVGQMDMQSVEVEPGKVSDVTVTFDKPGTYTFYCTRWCGLNHWRMRGTIEVSGGQSAPTNATVPLYVKLGLNIDAPHEAATIPASPPSAQRGQQAATVPGFSAFMGTEFYRDYSPYQVWSRLRAAPALLGRSDAQLWDLVAFIWQSNTTSEAVAEGRALFQQNCAACHGSSGKGNGVFADQLASVGTSSGTDMMLQRPANLADPKRMLGASPALLEGKILRGGMGTGMPSWGPIFTEDQIWKIVSYLYTFSFEETGR